MTYGKATELINQVAPGLVLSTASNPLPCYAAFIHYIQQLLTHVVVVPYNNNSCSLKEFKDDLKKKELESTIKSQVQVVYPSDHVASPLVLRFSSVYARCWDCLPRAVCVDTPESESLTYNHLVYIRL